MKENEVFNNNELEIFQMVYYMMLENGIYSFSVDDIDSAINMIPMQEALDKILIRSELWDIHKYSFINGYEANINDKSLCAVVELQGDYDNQFTEYIMLWSFDEDYQY